MSFYTLLYLRTISKAKKSLCPLCMIVTMSNPSPMSARNKEASHAL
jgi:hypothetical protein